MEIKLRGRRGCTQLSWTLSTIRTMQVIFLKILSSSLAVVATFMTLSTLLMVNLLNSKPHVDEHGHGARFGHDRQTSLSLMISEPHSEQRTPSDFQLLTQPFWNPRDYGEVGSPSPSCKPNLPLVILVASSPEHYDRRKAIRETWAQDWADPNDTDWRTIFMIGKTSNNAALNVLLEKEHAKHGDMLMGNYMDTYRNLTLKIQHGMAWALTNCKPQYLLKTDDDCFVNSKMLTKFLRTKNKQRTNLYAGFSAKTLEVVRDKKSQWYVSRETYRPTRFPSYASGTGYVLSRDVLGAMVAAAPYVQPFAAEDAYTGLLAQHTNTPLLDSARFALNNVNWRICNYLYLLVVHGVDPDQQVLGLRYSVESHKKCKGQPEPTDWN